jgi:hypothetical protein
MVPAASAAAMRAREVVGTAGRASQVHVAVQRSPAPQPSRPSHWSAPSRIPLPQKTGIVPVGPVPVSRAAVSLTFPAFRALSFP